MWDFPPQPGRARTVPYRATAGRAGLARPSGLERRALGPPLAHVDLVSTQTLRRCRVPARVNDVYNADVRRSRWPCKVPDHRCAVFNTRCPQLYRSLVVALTVVDRQCLGTSGTTSEIRSVFDSFETELCRACLCETVPVLVAAETRQNHRYVTRLNLLWRSSNW